MSGPVSRRASDKVSVEKVFGKSAGPAEGDVVQHRFIPNDQIADIVVAGNTTVLPPKSRSQFRIQVALQRCFGADCFGVDVERYQFTAGVRGHIERAKKDVIRIDHAVPLIGQLQNAGNLQKLLDMPTMEGPERNDHHVMHPLREKRRQELKPAGDGQRPKLPRPSSTLHERKPARIVSSATRLDDHHQTGKERNVLAIDDNIVALISPDEAIDTVAEQCEPFDVPAMARRYECYGFDHVAPCYDPGDWPPRTIRSRQE